MSTRDLNCRMASYSSALLAAVAGLCAVGTASAQYAVRELTDNVCCEMEQFDPRLRGAWGVTFAPGGPAWVASDFGGIATEYDGLGRPQTLGVKMDVPPLFNGGFAMGLVFNPGNGFVASDNAGGHGPARFVFAALEGIISAWTPRATGPQNTKSIIVVNKFAGGTRYTGLGLVSTGAGDRLLAADFHKNRIDAFNTSFAPVAMSFTDPILPAGFAPFNVRVLGGRVFVAYAVPDQFGESSVPGPGNGIIDIYGTDGVLESRLVTRGVLNSPWGMAIAPHNFGRFSDALLVANLGDGRINAFDQFTGQFLGTLRDAGGAPILIDGVHGLEFGNGQPTQETNTLFFTAGPTFGVVGIFGRIDIPATQACIADFNHDAFVDGIDSDRFNNAFATGNPTADINGDGFVDGLDFDFFMNHFEEGC